MRIRTYKVWGQAYVFPYIKITYDRMLNGDIEFIVGWFNRAIVLSI